MSTSILRQKIVDQLDTLSVEELIFIDKLLVDLKTCVQSKQSPKLSQELLKPEDNLALWGDFVGSFSAEPDLAENSEQIIQNLFTQKYAEPQ